MANKFNPLTGNFDLVSLKNFSFETIAVGKTICIPVNEQMIVHGTQTIKGTLKVKGILKIINPNPRRIETILNISSATALDAKPTIVLANADLGSFEIILPPASSGAKKLFIKRVDGNSDNTITIVGENGELIEQELIADLDRFESLTLIKDLTQWWVI